MTSKLFYGDNLHVRRESISDKSVDLIYLDPPQVPAWRSAAWAYRSKLNSVRSAQG